MKIWKKDYYEKIFRTYPKTIQDYKLIIEHAKEQIEELTKNCQHLNTTTKMMYGAHGGFEVNVCSDCGKYLDTALG